MKEKDTYFLQVAYAKILGSKLERFRIKKESPFMAVARCPVCGDSLKSKIKTRFSIYEKNHDLNVGCFNCGLTTTFISFLKTQYRLLFDEFMFEQYKLKDNKKHTISKEDFTPQKIVLKSKFETECILVKDLPDDHPAKLYIASRKLPEFPFYYTERFYEFSSKFNDEIRKSKADEGRILIPFMDRSGKIFAYQGRSLDPRSKQKYITIKIEKEKPLLFGFKTLNVKDQILLVEGPIDSLFLPNAIASVNASLSTTGKWLKTGINNPHLDLIIIHDNEPRNKSIVEEYKKTIKAGFKTVIWPKNVESYKDINDMILGGVNPLEVIKKNIYSGLTAELNLNSWKKI